MIKDVNNSIPNDYIQSIYSSNTQLKKSILWAFVFSLFTNIFLLAVPIYSLQVFDRVLSSQSLDTLALLTILILWFIFLYLALDWARARLISNSALTWQEKILKSLTLESIYLSKEASTKDTHLLQHVENIKSALSSNLITALDIPWSPLFIIILTFLHPIYGLISLLAVSTLIIIGLIHYYKTRNNHSPANPDLNILNHARTITALGMQEAISNKINKSNIAYKNYFYDKKDRHSNISVYTKATKLIAQISIIGIGSSLVLKGELTAGAMIAASMISGRALAPYESLVLNFSGWIKALKSWKELNRESRKLSSPLETKTKLPDPKGNIKATGIMYLYPNSEKPFLSGINLEIHQGSIVAIIGSSGSGKTTLLNILCGFKTPNLGSVRIDDATHSQWNSDHLGSNTGYYEPSSTFFSGTVKENISRFQTNTKDSSIIDACESVGMHKTILGWPKGYDTDINKDLRPSQSENQQLMLARAIYNKPPLLFLDEPDSFLDPKGLKSLAEILNIRKSLGLTTIFTTNRSELLSIPDRLIVMDKGRIIKEHKPASLQNSSLEKSQKKIRDQHET